MNFLKKKLKPLTSGLSNSQSKQTNQKQDLESDLYDDYVVEAPPHPSELLALGVDPTDIDVNDPEKLRELYRKVKEEGKEKKVNSVLLAKQRQKEEIEEKKKTREEWKFFDSLTARCEEAVKSSQKKLEELKETSTIDALTQPEYEFRDYSKEIAIATTSQESNKKEEEEEEEEVKGQIGLVEADILKLDEQDPFGFTISSSRTIESESVKASEQQEESQKGDSEQEQHIVEELLQDLGIDLRPSEQRLKSPIWPGNKQKESAEKKKALVHLEEDPFDTSFIESVLEKPETLESRLEAKFSNLDPFDTSFVKL